MYGDHKAARCGRCCVRHDKNVKGGGRKIFARKESNLALEIDSSEGLCSCRLEQLFRITCQENDGIVTFLEQVLTVMVDDELSSLGIRLEGQLLSEVAQFQIWFVTSSTVSMQVVISWGGNRDSRFAHVCECS